MEIKSFLALHWSLLLMFLRLFMVCEITHFGYYGATVWALIHRQLSAPMRKTSPIHSCTYNQNDKTLPLPRHYCRILSPSLGVGKHFLRRATVKILLLPRAACSYYSYNRFENVKKVFHELPQNECNNSHYRLSKNAVSNETCGKNMVILI